MRYSKSMIEAVKQVGLYERFDFVVVDKDNKIVTRQKNKQDAKEFEKFANSPAFKNTTMGKKYKKPFKVTPISPKDRKGIGDTIIGIGELTDKDREAIDEDVKNALAGFDNRIKDGGMDRKDLIKAKELYKRKDVKGLRKHIYSLDTSPLETVMNLISIQDRPFFDKMYPNTRGGEFLAKIAYDHRKLDENLDENKDDEKKRMKGAKLKLKMGDEVIKEDGHTDVSSAVRQCKTIVEDATQMMGKLQSMNGEESLPTWWTNKLAVASNSMNKIRDYLLVPSMQNERMEKGIDKLPRQFLNPDKEVMVMKKNKVIVIDKKDQDRYTKQGWELAEVLDKEDEPKVKEIVKKLKGASKAHAGQAKDLEKAVSETTITGKDLLENKYKEEKNGAQHFSKIEEDNYIWNFVYDDFGRTKLTTEPDKATHLVYTMEGKDNPQLLKISEKEILDYKKGETNEVSKK